VFVVWGSLRQPARSASPVQLQPGAHLRGDCGGYFIGFVLAALSIVGSIKARRA
jgi:hypothetical protein